MTPDEFLALAMAEPLESEHATYGYSMRIGSGNPSPPGVLAITWITARTPEEREHIREHAKQNVQDFLKEPGFLSIVTGFLGLRGFTVTAWESEEAMKRGLRGHHAKAMKELFEQDFVGSVWTSVWKPGRLNRLWLRCPSCSSLESSQTENQPCSQCHQPLPDTPPYW